MTVQIKSSGRGGGTGVLQFTDFTDTRGDQPSFLGDNWMMCGCDGNPNPGSALTIAGVYNVASGTASMGSTGSNGQSLIMSIPWKMDLNTLSALSQFAEYKMVSNNSAPGVLDRRGPMVLARPNPGHCYYVSINSEVSNAQIVRVNKSNITTTTLGATFPFTSGKKMRLEVDISDSLQNTLRAYVDGVLKITVVDNSVSRLTVGVPGIWDAFCSAGITQTLREFACGAL